MSHVFRPQPPSPSQQPPRHCPPSTGSDDLPPGGATDPQFPAADAGNLPTPAGDAAEVADSLTGLRPPHPAGPTRYAARVSASEPASMTPHQSWRPRLAPGRSC
jgi:hypothetical protein